MSGQSYTKFGIPRRLQASFGLVLVLLGLLTGILLFGMQQMNRMLVSIVGTDNIKITLAEEMRSHALYYFSSVQGRALGNKEGSAIEGIDKYEISRNGLAKVAVEEREKMLISGIDAHKLTAQALAKDLVKRGAGVNGQSSGRIFMNSIQPAHQKWLSALEELVAYEKNVAKRHAESSRAVYEKTVAFTLIFAVVAFLLSGFAAFLMTRFILRSLRKAMGLAESLINGDLTTRIELDSKYRTGSLFLSFQTMNDNLLRIVGDVRKSSDAVTVAAKEIAVGNINLSQRTDEQASSLEETAASMEELISTVKQNADNSKQANQLASNASNVAIKGGDIVGKVVVTMNLISGSSKKIVDIISVIEGIAFQTNILSLNAAVEAARAGEQGRGFAVVASEVHNLAQRSAAAAKEIKALIDDSVGKVSDGTQLVEEAGRTMSDIVTSVKKVNDIIAEIAAASEVQISGIEQVNQAIVQMDEVTQQNAALVEEAAASASALEELATNLNAALSLFKLDGSHAGLHTQAELNGSQPPQALAHSLFMISDPTATPALRQARSRMFGANLKIGARLSGGFAVLLSLMVALIVIGTSYLRDIAGNLNSVVREDNVMIDLSEKMRTLILYQAITAGNVALLTDVESIRKEAERMADYNKQYHEAADQLTGQANDETEKAMLADIKAREVTTAPSIKSAIKLGLGFQSELASKVLLSEVRPAQEKWLVALGKLALYVKDLAAKRAESAANASQYARNMMFILGAGALILGGLVAFRITISITRPLHQAVAIAKLVASGDLTGHIAGLSEDELGQLLRALKAMNDNLLRIVGDVRTSSDTITLAAKEIAVGNSDLSQRTEEQASNLEETTASMEELISTVKQNADNSRQASHLASNAASIAVKGGDIVGKVVVTMGLINESSKKIVDIISMIEDIAFQTNILSLNAAVEAARVGEQGRGFAMVAGEVRNLAQRSAGAAKEIKALIGDSVGKVSDGTKLVEEAGRTMDNIVMSVKKVNDIIAEIAAASEEQTAGIEQVNQAIVQMDEVTQQNAALVEEAAASAAALEEQANMLNEVVRTFKLKEHQNSSPPAQTEFNGAEETMDKSITVKLPGRSSLPRPRLRRVLAPERDTKAPNGDWRTF